MQAANVARHPPAALVAVYDLNAEAANTVAKSLGVPAAASAAEVFASAEVDAVLIATATPTHADYIEMAIAVTNILVLSRRSLARSSNTTAMAGRFTPSAAMKMRRGRRGSMWTG